MSKNRLPPNLLDLELLKSVREMKARYFARGTHIEVNKVIQACQSTHLSLAEFPTTLGISERHER